MGRRYSAQRVQQRIDVFKNESENDPMENINVLRKSCHLVLFTIYLSSANKISVSNDLQSNYNLLVQKLVHKQYYYP